VYNVALSQQPSPVNTNTGINLSECLTLLSLLQYIHLFLFLKFYSFLLLLFPHSPA
jgi:hypothetical protein